MNMMQVMQQAQKMQKKFKETQSELEQSEVVSEAGNGAVKVVLNGQGKFKSIKLTSDAVSVDDDAREMLEDLISSAMNQAAEKASKEMEAKMKQATGGLNIPGLF